MSIYKNTSRTIAIQSGVVTKDELKNMILLTDDINKQAKELEFQRYDSEITGDTPPVTMDHVNEAMPIRIWVNGEEGELLLTSKPETLEDHLLPKHISRIKIENSSYYRQIAKGVDPINHFEIVLDFSTSSIFDFISTPTARTSNESSIYILGQNDNWVAGTYEKLNSVFKDKKSYRSFIHKSNVYDLLLWFIFVPILMLYYFPKFDLRVRNIEFLNGSDAYFTVLYLCIFIIGLYIFRSLFNFSRWLFPYLELESQKVGERIILKSGFGFILLSIIGPLFYDLFKYLFGGIEQ